MRIQRNGLIKGRISITNGTNKEGIVFQGIPYASPPLNELRFKKPILPKNWTGILETTNFKKTCMWNSKLTNRNHDPSTMSEDCLYLNVYTSKYCINQGGCPTILYLHGGWFILGSPNSLGEETLIENYANDNRKIVFVSINFRLGSLGYLSLNQRLKLSMNTNIALFDVLGGLEWIKREIHVFGGNKDNVALMGHSAGSTAGIYIYTSQRSLGLIHKAIFISGPIVHPYLENANENYSRRLSIISGCSNCSTNWDDKNDVEKVLNCLRAIEVTKLLNYQRAVDEYGFRIFGPSSDIGEESFMIEPWNKLIKKKAKIPILVGGTKYEIVEGLKAINKFPNGETTIILDKVKIFCESYLSLYQLKNKSEGIRLCIEEYSNDVNKTIDIGDDFLFYKANYNLCNEAIDNDSDVYLYKFTYNKLNDSIKGFQFSNTTPFHSNDLVYLLGEKKNIFSNNDYIMQKKFSKIIVNFLYRGNPSSRGIKFEKYTKERNNYFVVDLNKDNSFIGMKNNYHNEGITFWTKTLKEKLGNFNEFTNDTEWIKNSPKYFEITTGRMIKMFVYPDSYYTCTNKHSELKRIETMNDSPNKIIYGFIRGIKSESNSKSGEAYAYLGIPYGSTRELRFKEPKSVPKWNGIRNATGNGTNCLTKSAILTRPINFEMYSEECLSLSIYTTKRCLQTSSCPVIVFIYNDGLNFKNATAVRERFTLGNFAKEGHNIVFVILNFRSGIFGNLNLNKNLPNLSMNTNVQLFDITLGLQWINDEIINFGGNKDNLSLMGYFTGSRITNMLRYSKRVEGLISKLILFVDSVDGLDMIDNSETISRNIAITTGCASGNTSWDSINEMESVLECMRNINEFELLSIQVNLEINGVNMNTPTIDYGESSFFQYNKNETFYRKVYIPILVEGTFFQDELTDENLDDLFVCQFFILYDIRDSEALLLLPHNSNGTQHDGKIFNLLDIPKKQCIEKLKETDYASIHQLNNFNYKPTVDYYQGFTNKVEGIYVVEKLNDNTERFDIILEELFSRFLLNFINYGTLNINEGAATNINVKINNLMIISDSYINESKFDSIVKNISLQVYENILESKDSLFLSPIEHIHNNTNILIFINNTIGKSNISSDNMRFSSLLTIISFIHFFIFT
uniref:Carboxylesterase type B domain-containing protein n=1 Tax=Parastrongyloides trichosuri TaxID=131310 RepID=A0A0N4Z6W2_PARTI